MHKFKTSLLEKNISGQEEKDVKPLPRINKHSVFWIVASLGLTYYVEFFQNLRDNDEIKRWLSRWGGGL